MKTDTLFYRLFQGMPKLALELLALEYRGAIKVQNLCKCYHIFDNPSDRLKPFVAPCLQRLTWQSPKQYFRPFWVLKVASLNGVGKTEKEWQWRAACD